MWLYPLLSASSLLSICSLLCNTVFTISLSGLYFSSIVHSLHLHCYFFSSRVTSSSSFYSSLFISFYAFSHIFFFLLFSHCFLFPFLCSFASYPLLLFSSPVTSSSSYVFSFNALIQHSLSPLLSHTPLFYLFSITASSSTIIFSFSLTAFSFLLRFHFFHAYILTFLLSSHSCIFLFISFIIHSYRLLFLSCVSTFHVFIQISSFSSCHSSVF